MNLIWIIGWNFQNIVSNYISIWLFNSFQTLVQIKTKLFWMEMKKSPKNRALTVCSNVIYINVNIYFRIWWTSALWRDFPLTLLVCILFYKQIVLNPFSINKNLLLFIKYRYLAITVIWLADSHSNTQRSENQNKRSRENPEERQALLIHLYRKASVME